MIAVSMWLLACALAPQDDSLPLTVGKDLRSELTIEEPSKSFDLKFVPEAPFYVDAHSLEFEVRLSLRSNSGEELPEDDSGWMQTHSRVAVNGFAEGTRLTLVVSARDETFGEFSLFARSGTPPEANRDGDLRVALTRLDEEVEQVRTVHGPHHARLLRLIDDRGHVEKALGEYESALESLRRGFELHRELLGDEHPDTVEAQNILGIMYLDMGRLLEAADHFEQVLEIRRVHPGLSHVDTATSLGNLGSAYLRLERLAEAEELCREGLETMTALVGREHPESLVILSSLSAILTARGKYGEAESGLLEVLGARRRSPQPRGIKVARGLQNLAYLSSKQGRMEQARDQATEALAIAEEVLTPQHPELRVYLINLANLEIQASDYATAREHLQRTLEICEERLGEDSLEVAWVLSDLATAYSEEGLHSEARDMLERCLAIRLESLPAWHPAIPITLNNLGSVLLQQRDLDGALAVLLDALEREQEQVENPDLEARTLSLLASCCRHSGDAGKARAYAERALAKMREVVGEDHVETARFKNNLAVLLVGQERLTLGCRLFEEAMEVFERDLEIGHELGVTCRSNLASLKADQGDDRAAWELMSHQSLEDMRRFLVGATEEQSYRVLANRFWQVELEQSYAARLSDPELWSTSFENLLNWKGQLAAFVQDSRGAIHRDLSPEQRGELDQLRRVIAGLSRMTYDEALDARERDARLAELIEDRKRLELRVSEFLDEAVQPRVTLDQIQARLPNGSALIDFLVCRGYEPAVIEDGEILREGMDRPAHLFAWVLGPGADHPRPLDLGPAGEMQVLVRDFLTALVDPKSEPSDLGSANEALRRRLWDPLVAYLGEAQLVFVSPDQFLGGLPFETLSSAGGRYLVEEYSFVYTQDLGALARLPETPRPRLAASLCVGGVDFDSRRSASSVEATMKRRDPMAKESRAVSSHDFGEWAPLANSLEEVLAVERSFPEGEAGDRRPLVLLGSDATEERLKRELPGKSHVHLATHGFFRPKGFPSLWDSAMESKPGEAPPEVRETPMRLIGEHPGLLSGLVFAGANGDPAPGEDDGYLTAEEVGWLDLSALDLVVLSGCETGLGAPRSGEGMLGLRRAFTTAGARTVISSLWTVEDKSTRLLMESFYERLLKQGEGKLAALHGAQIEMLRDNRSRRLGARPRTWGAFVLSGDWR